MMPGLMMMGDCSQGDAAEQSSAVVSSNESLHILEGKIEKLEEEFGELKRSVTEEAGTPELQLALEQEMAALRQQIAALRQQQVTLRQRELIMLKRSLPAEEDASLSEQLSGSKELVTQQMNFKKERLTEVKGVLSTIRTPQEEQRQSFWRVGSTTARELIRQRNILELNGDLLYPIDATGGALCKGFDLSRYASEDEGTPDLMKHHKEQLSLCGLPFGRGGYDIYDTRPLENCLRFKSSKYIFQGTTECTLAPHGLLGYSRATCMRVGFVHKRFQQGTEAPRPTSYAALDDGRTIAVALGAVACGSWPMFIDLTDGEVHHLLALRGELVVWEGLTPSQAYNKIAQDLNAAPHLASIDADLDKVPDDGDEDMRRFKRIRSTLQVPSLLREQLDSILPFLTDPEERYQAAFDIIASHFSAADSQEDSGSREEPKG